MVNFEEGTLIKEAYVVINGEEILVHMPEYSGNTPMSPENLNKMQIGLMELVFPIGSTYITQDETNPSSILGFGTWERSKGKVFVGLDEDDADFNAIGKTGGEKTHTLTIEEMPKHRHGWTPGEYYYASSVTAGQEVNSQTGSSGSTLYEGGDQPHNNLQPYEVVGYMWIRRA